MESSRKCSFMIKDILTESDSKKSESEPLRDAFEHHFESDSEEHEEDETRERDDTSDDRICDSSGETITL